MSTILIVDDRPTNRELLVTLLGYAGHRTLEASEGEEGLAIARAEHPDLIITDIVMPTMDGYEFARQVRADPSISGTQIIFYTSSFIVAETRRLAEACGVSLVISKPVEPQALFDTVKSALASTNEPVIRVESEEFHREHMRLLTDTLATKVEELESEIAEHKRAQEQVNYQASLLRNINDAVIATDDGFHITAWNRAAEKMYGWSDKEVMGRNVSEIIRSELTDKQQAEARDHLKESNTSRAERVYSRKDGQTIYVEENTIALIDQNRRKTGYVSVHRDITERKQAEQQNRFLANLVSSAADGIIAVDLQQNIQSWNTGAEAMYGWKEEEVLGRPAKDILDTDFLALSRETVTKQIMEKGFWSGEVLQVRRDGAKFPALSSVSLYRDSEGKPTGIVAVNRDITEQKQTEEKLRRSDQILRRVKALVLVANSQGMIEYASPSAKIMLGYEPEDLLGDGWWNVSRIEPLQVEREQEYLRKASRGEIPIAADPYERAIQDTWGNTHWISWVDAAGPNNTLIGVGHDITERKQAETKIQQQVERLTALSEIDRAITSTTDMRVILNVLLSHMLSLFGVESADILLLNPVLNLLEYAAGIGFSTKLIEDTQVRLGDEFAGRVALTREATYVNDLKNQPLHPSFQRMIKEEGFFSYRAVPLIAKGRVLGVLELYQKRRVEHDPDWLDFLEILADQAAIAIDNTQAFEGMQRSNIELTMAYDATIVGWSHAMDLRDKETEGHTQRVTELTLRLAESAGMNAADLVHVRRGALLHDMGKLGVPDSILLKPGKLTDEEWVIMRLHPTYARDMLSSIVYLRPAMDIPYCHHEKWDGSGYPRGLKGEQIPLAARIFSIVDVWDALTSDRPYRSAWSREKTLEHIREQSGKHFDPKVVEVFVPLIGDVTP